VKFVDEFRDPALARSLLQRIIQISTRPVRFMEFCGGHTHAILRYGLRQLLPPRIEMLSGPGCPVCVSANSEIDRAIAIAARPEVILATFGDMVRVPGSQASLAQARAAGADVRVVYSTLDALQLAQEQPHRQVVFLGVGFETTAPTVAAAILEAEKRGVQNFLVLSLHKLTPPAMRAILDAGEVALDGIIGPGHVATVIGWQAWEFLPRAYALPCAVSGFEPLDMLRAVEALVRRVEEGRPAVENVYERSVSREGNRVAREWMERVFQLADADWRGLGRVPRSGLAIRPEYAHLDAAQVLPVEVPPPREHPGCRCGEVLRGVVRPPECPLFGGACTPAAPVGPCMVSGEGACAAYYQYAR